jgi:hypothetical protein
MSTAAAAAPDAAAEAAPDAPPRAMRRAASAPALRAPCACCGGGKCACLEVFVVSRAFSEFGGPLFRSMTPEMRRSMVDLGICHYMTVFRTPDGRLVQFDFGPHGGDVEKVNGPLGALLRRARRQVNEGAAGGSGAGSGGGMAASASAPALEALVAAAAETPAGGDDCSTRGVDAGSGGGIGGGGELQ